MKGILVEAHGGPEILTLRDLPEPTPGPGEVAVTVQACGINHLDLWMRQGVPGHSFPLPLIPGSDVAGVVHAVGPGVLGVKPGDDVVVAPGTSCGHCTACLHGRDHHCRDYKILGEHRHGGYAERVVVPSVNVMPRPKELSAEQAAGLGVAHLTAWHMLAGRAELRPGETVLVQGAGSGVGSAAIQIAALFGAQVIAVSSGKKVARAQALGAQHVIDRDTQDVAKEVKRLTAGRGAEVVVDHIGGATFVESQKALAWQGRMVICGATAGHEVQLNLRHLFFKAQSLLGSTMGSKGEMLDVLQHAARGWLRPVIDRTLPLGDAAEAHRLLEARQVFGKLVLVP